MIKYGAFSYFDTEKVVIDIAALKWDSIMLEHEVDIFKTLLKSNNRKVYNDNAPKVSKNVTNKKLIVKMTTIRE